MHGRGARRRGWLGDVGFRYQDDTADLPSSGVAHSAPNRAGQSCPLDADVRQRGHHGVEGSRAEVWPVGLVLRLVGLVEPGPSRGVQFLIAAGIRQRLTDRSLDHREGAALEVNVEWEWLG